ncbi:hypothetical protein AVEN_198878-1 [Araneus ventricosus]|uniref:Uncharacterized protein n=1 Tax=Araneus ventricosus TaxID=182803 RepID=A0A4Y2ACU9_ARAVE|nr:hypothetical protein AVEN_243141-1 [Araneus ventricosus]GBL77510.1 hypothetical protein AVEN_122496-1 [Araneus ventricosus]GBL77515.1 hypothetical protein AVEN_122761-1 [Araneus ventricosus]GBL77526.1 hypothetical protein AVEN_198878-1 [Araneus ventricosus]
MRGHRTIRRAYTPMVDKILVVWPISDDGLYPCDGDGWFVACAARNWCYYEFSLSARNFLSRQQVFQLYPEAKAVWGFLYGIAMHNLRRNHGRLVIRSRH